MIKLGSLFDGSGGFPLAGALHGITPVWASEIEPYPIAVTKSRFKMMQHYGDVSEINGAEIEPVDVITFGSPCQDMSIAGKRAGIKHEDNGDEETTRSGLFMEAVRIIKEMRQETDGIYPAFAVWENVPGAYSSNKGEDFRTVLEEIEKIADPEAGPVPGPPKGKWAYAGEIVGDGHSIAWRTFDAQYWGVPQRRRRIYLVADFRGRRAGKILFERKGVRRDSETCGAQGQETAADARGRTRGSCGPPAVVYAVENHPSDSRVRIDHSGKCQTLTSRMGMGGGNVPLILKERAGCTGGGKGALWSEKAFTLATNMDMTVICLNDQGGNSLNVEDSGMAPTLRAQSHQHEPVVTIPTKEPNSTCYAIGNGQADGTGLHDVAGTLNCMHDQQAIMYPQNRKYIVRRLTPTECARLQGFPGWWGTLAPYNPEDEKFWHEVMKTHKEINGKKYKPVKDVERWYNRLHTDSAEYKMWGNGIALPNASFILEGIKESLL